MDLRLLLGSDRLRVRNGATHTVEVPWSAVASVTYKEEDLESSVWTLQPPESDRGTDLQVGVSGRVNVHVVLRGPTEVATAMGPMEIVELSFFADEPRPLLAHARTRLEKAERSR